MALRASGCALLKRIGAAMGHPLRLFYMLPALLKLGGHIE
jgi:hypothetical protein